MRVRRLTLKEVGQAKPDIFSACISELLEKRSMKSLRRILVFTAHETFPEIPRHGDGH